MDMAYAAADNRSDSMLYRRSGRGGLLLPAVSLGLWRDWRRADGRSRCNRPSCAARFDLGVTRFDLANNYGPP